MSDPSSRTWRTSRRRILDSSAESALTNNQTSTRESKFPAHFINSRDLARVLARRNVFERHLKLHGHRLRTRRRDLRRVNRPNLKRPDAALIEETHADLHPARLRVGRVRLGIVDIEIH